MLKYLLDTNVVIYVIKQRPLQVLDVFNRHHGRMAISAITLAELIQGVEKSKIIFTLIQKLVLKLYVPETMRRKKQ